jgi:hypothetical protein
MFKIKKWLLVLVLLPLLFLFLKVGMTEIQTIVNYFITKDVVDMGGASSQSTNYKLIDAIGQPGGVGAATSTNYRESSGFFASGEAPLAPVLSVTPTTLNFGTTQTSLSFHIMNTGGGTLTWTVTESPDKPWITSITPASGSGNAAVTVTVNRSLLVGSSDTGTLAVSSNGGSANVIVSIQAAVLGVPILPSASETQTIGNEFWVDINVGNSTNPVSNLFGVSFELNYTNTTFLDVVTPHASNVLSGDFMGSDVVFIQTVDETAGKVSIGISRTAGQGNGFGTVARVKFVSDMSTPDGTNILFSLTSVTANDPVGTPITLTPATLTVTLSGGLIVWPGDTNNDGIANQADILPIGLFWAATGPARPGASMAWTGQPTSPWTPENATYADANGDGTVNQADVLPIGLNWGQTHGLLAAMSEEKISTEQLGQQVNQTLRINISGSTKPNEVCLIEIIAENVTNLFGISFDVAYSPTSYIDSVWVEEGSWLGTDIIFYPVVDIAAGKISFGISRKAGQGGISGTGIVASLNMKMMDIPPVETDLSLQNVIANDHLGNSINFDVVNTTITAVADEKLKAIPKIFNLQQNYPNPFNPETTIEYNLPQPAEVMLTIYDIQGHQVSSLICETQAAGYHSVRWDATDNNGNIVTSGVYFYRIKIKSQNSKLLSFTDVKKMILMK